MGHFALIKAKLQEKEEGKKATSSIGSEETRDSDEMGKNVEPSEEDKQRQEGDD